MFKFFSLSSKSVSFSTPTVLSLVAKFAVTFSAISINSGAAVYFLWSGILLSTVLRTAVIANLLIRGISPLTLFISLLRVVLVANLEISGILSSISLILAL